MKNSSAESIPEYISVVITVFPLNSGPIKIAPRISRITFKIKVIVEMLSGIKVFSMIEIPVTLPTARLLGIRKKKTAQVARAAPTTMEAASFIIFLVFIDRIPRFLSSSQSVSRSHKAVK